MPSASQSPDRAGELADASVATVREWLDEGADDAPASPLARFAAWRRTAPARMLTDIVADPAGCAWVIAFIDGVVRPDSLRAAARRFERLSQDLPRVMPLALRILIQLGGGFALLLPTPFVPLARAAFRRGVGHLVLDADERGLDSRLEGLKGRGIRLSLSALGGPVLGSGEADRRLSAIMDLLGRADVDRVSIRLSDVVGPIQSWAYDETVIRTIDRLAPLYESAAAAPATKLITLEMGEYRHRDLTVDVFRGLLERPALAGYEGAITLQAYLPDALATMQALTEWGTARRARGGAGIMVRLVKGGWLATERTTADVAGSPLPVLPNRLETDANFKRVLEWTLTPERTDAVRVGVATHNLFDLAWVWHLAGARGVGGRVDFEMLRGVSPQAAAVGRRVGGIVLHTPVVGNDDIAAASGYLVERFAEQSDQETFVSAATAIAEERALFDREAERFRASVALVESTPPPEDHDDGEHPTTGGVRTATAHTAPTSRTDPAGATGRRWARQILARARESYAGSAMLEDAVVRDAATLDGMIAAAVTAGDEWAARPLTDRVTAIKDFAAVLAALRGRLVEVLVSEVGLTFAEAEAEAVRGVAMAQASADQATVLDIVEHAAAVPASVTLVAPGWTTPISDIAEAVAAALVAGSAVVVQPAHQARRSAAVVIEALREAQLPRGLVNLVVPEDATVAKAAVAHPDVDRVIFSGDRDTALLLRSWRPDRPPLGDVRGVASVIVTESADRDSAVADIVRGAFAHGAQHPMGARLVIFVGEAGDSEAFRVGLADAVRSTHPAAAFEASARMGPLIGTPPERVRRLLATLHGEERWLVEPEALDDRLTLWRPGVRDGVAPDVAIDRVVAAPSIVLTTVPDLEAAIDLQNAAAGDAAAIQTLDLDELAAWLDSADAGALFVNRATVGVPVDTLPNGGWRGLGALRGGAERALALTDWVPVFSEPRQSVRLDGISDPVRALIEAAQPSMTFTEFDLVRSGATSDELAWAGHSANAVELGESTAQRNVVRQLPVATTIRLAEGASPAQLIRVLAAATRAGARVDVSTAQPLPDTLVQLFAGGLSPVRVGSVLVETDARWHARLQADGVATPRIRLVGGDARVLALVLARRPEIALHAAQVTTSGLLELLPFLRAQVVSMTAHRYGLPDPMIAQIEF